MIFYARSTGGFYDPEVHGSIPADAVEITADEHAALMLAQSAGKVIVPGVDGRPIAAEPAPATEAELGTLRRAAIAAELTAIDAASARPLRAIIATQAAGGEAAPADVAKIAELEAQAVLLRAELAALEA